jgi:glycerol kinase
MTANNLLMQFLSRHPESLPYAPSSRKPLALGAAYAAGDSPPDSGTTSANYAPTGRKTPLTPNMDEDERARQIRLWKSRHQPSTGPDDDVK